MDLNEIKNRAKDLIADLAEPRLERDERGARDEPVTRTDRPDEPLDRPAGRDEALAGERSDLPVADRDALADRDAVADRDVAADRDAAAGTAPAADRWEEPTATASGGRETDRRADPGEDLSASALVQDQPRREAADPAGGDLDRTGSGEVGSEQATRSSWARSEPTGDDLFREPTATTEREPAADRHRAPESEWSSEEAPPTSIDATGSAPLAETTESTRSTSAASSTRSDTVVGSADEPTGFAASPADPERLITPDRAESYSARWDQVKGEFVDAPRQAVAGADALVGELLDELGQLFAKQRREIERDLDNDEVGTEELRVALRRYRSFFDRLLSV